MASKGSGDYWSDRVKKLEASMQKQEDLVDKEIQHYYAREVALLDKDIAAYYAAYGKDNVLEYRQLLLDLSDEDRQLLIEQVDAFVKKYPEYADLVPVRETIYKLDRLEGLRLSIDLHAYDAGAYETNAITTYLTDTASKAYAEAMDFAGGFNAEDTNLVKTIIGKDWAGAGDYSARIWANTEKLSRTLKTEIAAGFIRGNTYDDLIKIVKKRFDVSLNEARRLIVTEGTYVMNEANSQAFESVGFEEYRYAPIGDADTCEICEGLAGMVFKFADRQPGVNFPPMHPNCRCSFEVVIDSPAEPDVVKE